MVGCQKLLLSDLEAQESLTSLSGHTIKITKKEVVFCHHSLPCPA